MRHPFKREFWTLSQSYFATAGGVLMVTFGDTIKNGGGTRDTSALHRASDGLRALFPPDVAAYAQAWITLLLLIGLALILCWLARPEKKREAFMLGLSIYALLAAFSPSDPQQNENAAQTLFKQQATARSTGWGLISSAYAADMAPTWNYYLHFVDPDHPSDDARVTLRILDKNEQYPLGSLTARVGSIVQLNLQAGTYVLYVECAGCDRARYTLDVEQVPYQASEIALAGSKMPLSLQRLFRPTRMQPRDLSAAEAQKLAQEYASQHGG